MFLGNTQKKQILQTLRSASFSYPQAIEIANNIESYGIESEYISVTDADNQQLSIKLDEGVYLYSQQCHFFYNYDLSDTDVKAYITEVLDFEDYKDSIENDISAYYDSLDEIKELYKEDYKMIALECIIENLAIENSIDVNIA